MLQYIRPVREEFFRHIFELYNIFWSVLKCDYFIKAYLCLMMINKLKEEKGFKIYYI